MYAMDGKRGTCVARLALAALSSLQQPHNGLRRLMHSMEGSPPGTDESNSRESPAAHSAGWRFPALLLLVLVAVAIIAFSQRPPVEIAHSTTSDSWTPAPLPTGETVQLVIDFGNGATREFNALPWSPNMTVADVLKTAQSFRPAIRFTQQGDGESGFLTSLEGVENEGDQQRNWRFLVDGDLGKTSFCIAQVESGSSVLWEYTEEY